MKVLNDEVIEEKGPKEKWNLDKIRGIIEQADKENREDERVLCIGLPIKELHNNCFSEEHDTARKRKGWRTKIERAVKNSIKDEYKLKDMGNNDITEISKVDGSWVVKLKLIKR